MLHWKRKLEQQIFELLIKFSTIIIAGILIYILGTILIKGVPALSWEMISQVPSGGFYLGGGGGVLNAIIGSLYLAFGATLLALVISLPIVLYMNIFSDTNSRFNQILRLNLDILFGIPSIVYGSFAFLIMMAIGCKASLLAGIVTVGIFVFPILVRTMDEVLKTIPKDITNAGLSLGATKLEVAIFIALRQVLPGLITGVLLAFGRAIGDAASVLFTTGFTDNIPTSVLKPAATLPLSIFFQLGSPFEEVRQRAYAAAVILTFIVLIISILSRLAIKKFSKNIIK
jgi:phosphate transport system permease protein